MAAVKRKRSTRKRKRSERTSANAKGTTIRAFAKAAGVTHRTICKAIQRGVLSRSVGRRNGRAYIRDAELAAREWAARRADDPPTGVSADGPISLVEAQKRVAIQQEIRLSLANAAKEGRLIDADRARREAYDSARIIRDAILNIPDRLAAELAAEADATRVFSRLDAELRSALVGVAEILASEDDNDEEHPDGALRAGAAHG